MVGKDRILGVVERPDHGDLANFLAQTRVSRAGEEASPEHFQQRLFGFPNQQTERIDGAVVRGKDRLPSSVPRETLGWRYRDRVTWAIQVPQYKARESPLTSFPLPGTAFVEQRS